MLERKRVYFILCFAIVGIIVISQIPPMATVSFDWGVEADDALVYFITITETSSSKQSPSALSYLNNETIIVNITSLAITCRK